MLLIALNGPPHSGKDVIGGILHQQLNFQVFKFAAPLRLAAADLLCVDPDKIEELKDAGDGQVRQLMIAISEQAMKPIFGEGIFGHLLAQRIKAARSPRRVVVTDSGFEPELATLRESLPSYRIHLIRVYRPGTDFHGDSRAYLPLPHHTLINNSSLDELERRVHALVEYLEYAEGGR